MHHLFVTLILKEVRCFAGVALGRSQPAMSQAITRLERATGARLFDRTAREVRLTAEGKALLPYAERMIESAAAFSAEAARLARPTIHLAYSPLVRGPAAGGARRPAGGAPRAA